MRASRWACYAIFYVLAIVIVIAIKANPGRGFWWAPPLLYAVMSWPFFMWYHYGKFQFTPHYVESIIEQQNEEASVPRIVVDRPTRRRGPTSLDLLRQADAEHRRKKASQAQSGPNRPPAIQRPVVSTKPEPVEKPVRGKRPTVSKHAVPTLPADLPPPAASTVEHTHETADDARDYWQAKLQSRARHPGEFSLPLFPEEEKALNAAVTSEDPFL